LKVTSRVVWLVDIFKNNETFPLFSSRLPPGYKQSCQVMSGMDSSRKPRLRMQIPGVALNKIEL
jgi:hypothetical protein